MSKSEEDIRSYEEGLEFVEILGSEELGALFVSAAK